MSVLLLAVGLACQHWIMLLVDVARTSNQVTGTSSRLSKVSLIADLLQQCARQVVECKAPADEIGLATCYLSGSLRQRRIGIELSWQSGLPTPPDADLVTVSELDAVMQQASDLAGTGSSRARTQLFLGLVRQLTTQERTLVLGLLRGVLMQAAGWPGRCQATGRAQGAQDPDLCC
jgi:DNA ligase-1